MRCPLPRVDDEDLEQGVQCLLRKCKKTSCDFWEYPHSDGLPDNCILLVVALLDKKGDAT